MKERKNIKNFEIRGLLNQKQLLRNVDQIINDIRSNAYTEISIKADFRTSEVGGGLDPYASYNEIVTKKNNGVQYPYQTFYGSRDIHDGKKAIQKICQAIANSTQAVITFEKCQFYPDALEHLKTLATTNIQYLNFTNCSFFTVSNSFFKENFSSSNVTVSFYNTKIYQKDLNKPGVTGSADTAEYFELPEDNSVEIAGEYYEEKGDF